MLRYCVEDCIDKTLSSIEPRVSFLHSSDSFYKNVKLNQFSFWISAIAELWTCDWTKDEKLQKRNEIPEFFCRYSLHYFSWYCYEFLLRSFCLHKQNGFIWIIITIKERTQSLNIRLDNSKERLRCDWFENLFFHSRNSRSSSRPFFINIIAKAIRRQQKEIVFFLNVLAIDSIWKIC